VREYEILTDDAFTYASIGRSVERPWGLDGGLPGTVNYMEIVHDGIRRRSARVPNTILRRGDRVTIVTGGGGGYGDPLTRPPSMVAADVADDYITKGVAREIYGVVIGADGRVDEKATARRRPR
jgi:N-methylhydantoinase B